MISSRSPYALWRKLVCLLVFGSLINVISIDGFLTEVNSSFGGYYLVAHCFVIVLLFIELWRYSIGRKVVAGLIAVQVVLVIRYLVPALPFFVAVHTDATPAAGSGADETVSVLFANVHGANQKRQLLIDQVQAESPDIVALIEVTPDWLKALQLNTRYPFFIELPRPDNFGLALYSRLPLKNQYQLTVGQDIPPALIAAVERERGGDLHIAVLHARPPLGPERYHQSSLLLRRVATVFRHSSEDFILAGDLNASPFSKLYRRLINRGQLKSAMYGYGLARTWTAHNPVLRLTLDHLLYKGRLRVVRFKRLGDIGSDHYPLLATFASAFDSRSKAVSQIVKTQ